MKSFRYENPRVILGRLERGDDLLEGLTRFCVDHQVQAGSLQAIGAVERGAVGYYDQAAGAYREIKIGRALEIASLVGNISIKEGKTFLHCHIVLADSAGECIGGHLLEGNTVFACEVTVLAVEGEIPVRVPEQATGLMLW